MNTERVSDASHIDFREIENHKDDLFYHVKNLLTNDPKPNDESFLMERIQGFSPARLVARYIYLHEQMVQDGATNSEINNAFSELVETDTKAYASEFLYRSPILQTEYAIKNIKGVPSVVMPKYDPNSPLHTHISLKERDGATFYGILNLERALLEAKQYSTVIYASPSGWNGTGEAFTESQIHSVNIADGQIIDTVLRLSLTPEETKTFIENLTNQKINKENEIELIKEISQTTISFPYDIPPQELLSRIKTIKGSEKAWNRMKLKENKIVFDRSFSFKEIEEILNKDNFLKTSDEVDEIILDLKNYLIENSDIDSDSLREMVRHIGKAALEISESIGIEVGEIKERKTAKGDYSAATKYASEGSGCDPRENKTSRFEQYQKEGIEGRCSQCGEYTKVICNWCMKCAEAGGNYKDKQEDIEIENKNEKEDLYGSFLVRIIAGAILSFTKS